MKTQICISALLILATFANNADAQIEIRSYPVDSLEISESYVSTQIKKNDLDLRTINPAGSERLFIECPLVLKEAFLDILDGNGTSWIEQSFAVLSELDLSVKSLAPGDYTLRIRSNQGSTEKIFSK